jgi:two-component system alkaline phosphatase synthesis response regulator PhoP
MPKYRILVVGDEQDILELVKYHLARRPGWVFARTQIVDAVRSDDYPVTDRGVDVQIEGLRRKLNSDGRYIDTFRSIGYRFKEKP